MIHASTTVKGFAFGYFPQSITSSQAVNTAAADYNGECVDDLLHMIGCFCGVIRI